MKENLHRLFESLNILKGFETAYSSESNRELLVKIEDKVYKMTLEDIGEKELTINVIKKHLR